MKFLVSMSLFFVSHTLLAQTFISPFEKSNFKETATYQECISFYTQLDEKFTTISIKKIGNTDAGYPLHLVLYSKDKDFDNKNWHLKNKVVILINNAIHAGEPDGVDASMMFIRDLAFNKISIPKNVIIAVIPVYNIGGCLNRNGFSRVNQNGPLSYGFRGNSQNLDLNRDFIKCDSKESESFANIFHYLNPDILIDNHVSDGADYQHTITLLTTQHNKLGGSIGNFLHSVFEPKLFDDMKNKNWPMCPYVNFETANPDKGWIAFYDPPRFASGYAAIFKTMAFVIETHMLKPFADRVKSTYALMETITNNAGKYASEIVSKRQESLKEIQKQKEFPLNWIADSTQYDIIHFKGYEFDYIKSEVTGLDRLYYNHEKPFTKPINFYNYFIANHFITKPKAYVIPQGWQNIIRLLKNNRVVLTQLQKDSVITVEAYRIENYKTLSKPYEKHYKHYDVQLNKQIQQVHFLKGDYLIYTNQIADRFLVETLEPEGDDSYFCWNFFDAILQQKEGYSDYRWEDVAADFLKHNPDVKKKLEEKKKADTSFKNNASAQLNFVYKNSPYYEVEHLRYPVFRIN